MSQTPRAAPQARSGEDRFLGREISPLTRRRLHNFRANARGYWSFWIFLAIFFITLFAEFVANDKPFLVYHEG
ncbi:MAG: ABC transporter permease, partial [Proteobacteria bacterium]|nr:ABC transporter permease [Pseudomonadota bacterium]